MTPETPLPSDDRAVSTTLGYVLTLGISMLLITGLVTAAGTYVENQREQVVRSELTVIGEQLSSDLGAVDRLARTWGTDREIVTRYLPNDVAGKTYTVEVVNPGPPGSGSYLELTTSDPEVTVTVKVDLELDTTIAGGSVDGGAVEIVYDGSELVIRNG